MSRLPSFPGRTQLVLGLVVLAAGGAFACEEDGKTVPATCPQPPIYDIQGGAKDVADPADCITDVGHAVNTPASSGGTSTGGTSNGGKGGTPAAEAGAGGA